MYAHFDVISETPKFPFFNDNAMSTHTPNIP